MTENNDRNGGMGVWMVLGAGVGLPVGAVLGGVFFDSIAMGVGIGIALGAGIFGIGLALGDERDGER